MKGYVVMCRVVVTVSGRWCPFVLFVVVLVVPSGIVMFLRVVAVIRRTVQALPWPIRDIVVCALVTMLCLLQL